MVQNDNRHTTVITITISRLHLDKVSKDNGINSLDTRPAFKVLNSPIWLQGEPFHVKPSPLYLMK